MKKNKKYNIFSWFNGTHGKIKEDYNRKEEKTYVSVE